MIHLITMSKPINSKTICLLSKLTRQNSCSVFNKHVESIIQKDVEAEDNVNYKIRAWWMMWGSVEGVICDSYQIN